MRGCSIFQAEKVIFLDIWPQKAYNIVIMYSWTVDTLNLKKDSGKYTIWKLEQLINFGLNGKMIDAKELIKYWKEIKIDLRRRKLLSF